MIGVAIVPANTWLATEPKSKPPPVIPAKAVMDCRTSPLTQSPIAADELTKQGEIVTKRASSDAHYAGDESVNPALVSIEGGWQIGLEPLENGWVTVFLPQAPTPMSGFQRQSDRPGRANFVEKLFLRSRDEILVREASCATIDRIEANANSIVARTQLFSNFINKICQEQPSKSARGWLDQRRPLRPEVHS
jgi:hypothetical protein